jgi:hypothetical protein
MRNEAAVLAELTGKAGMGIGSQGGRYEIARDFPLIHYTYFEEFLWLW